MRHASLHCYSSHFRKDTPSPLTSFTQYQLHFMQNKSFLFSQILHILNILIKQYRPSTYTLIICSQGLSIWELIAEIKETTPLIQGNFVITCILRCLQKVTEGIKTMCSNTASSQTHFEKGNDQVLIQSLVCPCSIELEAKLYSIIILIFHISSQYITKCQYCRL